MDDRNQIAMMKTVARSMKVPAEANRHPRTPVDDPQCLAICFKTGELLFHNESNNDEWITSRNPVNLHEWA